MATSISIGGSRTSVPGTAADPRFDTSGRALPAAKTLAVIGEFEQFKNGSLVPIANAGAMATRAPGDELLEQVAGIAFNPAADPLVGAPGEILIGNVLPSAAASATLVDSAGRPSVRLEAKIAGRYGNAIRFGLTANGTKRDLTLTRQGTVENLTALGSGPVITAAKLGTWADDIFFAAHAPIFDEALGDVTGRVVATLHKALRVGGGTYTVPTNDRNLTGPAVFSTRAVALGEATTDVASETFTLVGHGLEVGDPVRVTGLVGTTIGTWSSAHIGYVIGDGFSADTFRLARTPNDTTLALGGTDGTATITRVAPYGVSALSSVATDEGTEVFTRAAHGLLIGDPVLLTAFATTAIGGHTTGRVYYVIEDGYGVDTFKLSTEVGGSSVNITGDGTCTVTYRPFAVTITGINADGAATVETLAFTVGANAPRSTVASWIQIDEIVIPENGAGSGLLDLVWKIADISRLDAPNLGALAAVLGDLPNVQTTIKSARVASMTLADLDFAASAPGTLATPFNFTADSSEFARQVRERSRYATAERVLPAIAPENALSGNFNGAAGSSIIVITEGDPSLLAEGSTLFVADGLFTLEVEEVDGAEITLREPLPVASRGMAFTAWASGPATAPEPIEGTQAFTGGLTGVAGTESRQALFDALKLTETSIIVVLSYDAALINAAVAHARLAAGIGEKECNVWVAQPRSTDLDGLDTFTLGLNTRHVSVCAEDIRVIDPSGARRWLDSRFQALQCGAMQAGVPIGEPVTSKRPRVLETRGGSDWNGQSTPDALIQAGVVTYRRDSLGFQVTRAITTHRSNDDVNQTEVSANESAYWQIRDMREELRAAIGRSSGVFYPAALVATVIGRAKRQLDARLIASFDVDSVYLTQTGDTVVVGYDFSPNVPINFAIVRPTVRPVRFEFNVS